MTKESLTQTEIPSTETKVADVKPLSKREKLKKKIIIMSVSYLVFIGFYYLLNDFMVSEKGKVELENASVKVEASKINNDLAVAKNKISEIKEATALWNNLNDKYRKRTGLNIDEAKSTLEMLENKHFLVPPTEIIMSPPVEMTNSSSYKTDSIVVVSSDVTIKFKAIIDIDLLNFVGDLEHNFPGYIRINSLFLERRGNVGPEIIKQIKKGDPVSLVAGELVMSWRDLKDIVPTQPVAVPGAHQ
jgi:hypothetical protein